MHIAIVNKLTGLVENVIVPPREGDVFIPPETHNAVLTGVGGIGDIYDGETFVKPVKAPEV